MDLSRNKSKVSVSSSKGSIGSKVKEPLSLTSSSSGISSGSDGMNWFENLSDVEDSDDISSELNVKPQRERRYTALTCVGCKVKYFKTIEVSEVPLAEKYRTKWHNTEPKNNYLNPINPIHETASSNKEGGFLCVRCSIALQMKQSKEETSNDMLTTLPSEREIEPEKRAPSPDRMISIASTRIKNLRSSSPKSYRKFTANHLSISETPLTSVRHPVSGLDSFRRKNLYKREGNETDRSLDSERKSINIALPST